MIALRAMALRFERVGSRVTCNPPPTDTDADYIVLVENHSDFRPHVLGAGFSIGGSRALDVDVPLDHDDRFSSYVRGEINLIVTSDASFFRRFMAATSVAKRLNLMHKPDRIALFQAVLYGNACD